MAKINKVIYVKIVGTGINEVFQARSHEIVGFPANTYHKFIMLNDAEVWFNDFGVRSVTKADAPEDLQ